MDQVSSHCEKGLRMLRLTPSASQHAQAAPNAKIHGTA